MALSNYIKNYLLTLVCFISFFVSVVWLIEYIDSQRQISDMTRVIKQKTTQMKRFLSSSAQRYNTATNDSLLKNFTIEGPIGEFYIVNKGKVFSEAGRSRKILKIEDSLSEMEYGVTDTVTQNNQLFLLKFIKDQTYLSVVLTKADFNQIFKDMSFKIEKIASKYKKTYFSGNLIKIPGIKAVFYLKNKKTLAHIYMKHWGLLFGLAGLYLLVILSLIYRDRGNMAMMRKLEKEKINAIEQQKDLEKVIQAQQQSIRQEQEFYTTVSKKYNEALHTVHRYSRETFAHLKELVGTEASAGVKNSIKICDISDSVMQGDFTMGSQKDYTDVASSNYDNEKYICRSSSQ